MPEFCLAFSAHLFLSRVIHTFFEIYSFIVCVSFAIEQTNPALNIADPATNASGSGWFPILLVFVFDLFDMAGRALPNFTRWVPLLSTRALFIGTMDF